MASKINGYVLKLSQNRYLAFKENERNKFIEPVKSKPISRRKKYICFIADSEKITHIGIGKKGLSAGTELSKFEITDIFDLEKDILFSDAILSSPSAVKSHLKEKLNSGGLVATKSLETLVDYTLTLSPKLSSLIDKLSGERLKKILRYPEAMRHSLSEQKEALLTALNIANIDRTIIGGWDVPENNIPESFLDGLESVKLREDSMIINDLNNFPGFDLVKSTHYSSCLFQNKSTTLTVVLANRLPLEELIGTDLIYCNEELACFIMIQYKVMEKDNDSYSFRIPNKQFTEELDRMGKLTKLLQEEKSLENLMDFRFNENPFFIKLCPRINIDPEVISLSKGMYIPLDYVNMLTKDSSIKGARGGKKLSYNTVGRYLDNPVFKNIVSGGWIGTNYNQSNILKKVIKETIENGRSAVIAIRNNIEKEIHDDD